MSPIPVKNFGEIYKKKISVLIQIISQNLYEKSIIAQSITQACTLWSMVVCPEDVRIFIQDSIHV